jgi:hypothetical protein
MVLLFAQTQRSYVSIFFASDTWGSLRQRATNLKPSAQRDVNERISPAHLQTGCQIGAAMILIGRLLGLDFPYLHL